MRLHILSDIYSQVEALHIPATDADVVILAGDISEGTNGLPWIKKQFPEKPVIYVLGNHEFHGHALPKLTDTLRRKTAGTNVHLLEDSIFQLNGFTILGCTLWTSFLVGHNPWISMMMADALMADFYTVKNSTEQRALRARDTARIHQESVLWLKSEMACHDPARTIVVTHHAPSRSSEAPDRANSPLNPTFTSDLNAIIEPSGIALWIHGHTRYNVDYRIGATRVLSNQWSHPEQTCKGFDPGLVVEV